MTRKDAIDLSGAVALVGFSLMLGFNQVVIKLTNGGFHPVFFAGMRSGGSLVVLAIWMWWRGIRFDFRGARSLWGALAGLCFTVEFTGLFLALDLTSVSRASILFYSMPVWLALAGHFFLPGERLSPVRWAGLALAMGGVVIAVADRGVAGQALNPMGDLGALIAAWGWAGIAFLMKGSRARELAPEMQLFWQLLVSMPALIAIALIWGDPLLRDPSVLHFAGLAFQVVVVSFAGYLLWFWFLTVYPASGVASFSFLAPVFSVFLGWLILGERIGWEIVVSLVLVAAGLVLINRR